MCSAHSCAEAARLVSLVSGAKPKPMRSLFSLSMTSDAMSLFWPGCGVGAAMTRASLVGTCLLRVLDEGTDSVTGMFAQLASAQPARASRILPVILLIVRHTCGCALFRYSSSSDGLT